MARGRVHYEGAQGAGEAYRAMGRGIGRLDGIESDGEG